MMTNCERRWKGEWEEGREKGDGKKMEGEWEEGREKGDGESLWGWVCGDEFVVINLW